MIGPWIKAGGKLLSFGVGGGFGNLIRVQSSLDDTGTTADFLAVVLAIRLVREYSCFGGDFKFHDVCHYFGVS